jgi:hypothetical protein
MLARGTIIGCGFTVNARAAAHAAAPAPSAARITMRAKLNHGTATFFGRTAERLRGAFNEWSSRAVPDCWEMGFLAIKSRRAGKAVSLSPSVFHSPRDGASPTLARVVTALLVAALAIACGPPPAPKTVVVAKAPPPLVVEHPRPRLPPPPEWTFWEPVEADVHVVDVPSVKLPLADADVTRLGPDAVAWTTQTPELIAQLLRDGSCVVPLQHPRKLGEYYVHLRELGIPYFITMDALFRLAHMTFSRVLADVEWRIMAPALASVLASLDARLAAESRNVGSDLAPAYALARGAVAVARALDSPAYAPPKDLAAIVAAETTRARNHIGPAKSDLFGVPLDYSAFAPSGGADVLDGVEEGAGASAAFTWLASAPFLVASRADAASSPTSVATARTHTRAAMILARLLVTDADPETRAKYTELSRARELIFGHTDDVSPAMLAIHVSRAGAALSDPRSFTNVVTVDRVRHALLAARKREVDDALTPALSVRLAGDERAEDAATLSALAFPSVGAFTGAPTAEGQSAPSTVRLGARALPTALDVAAWLGSDEARVALAAQGDDAYARYEAALSALGKRFDADDLATRHATPYASFVDAIAAYLRTSPADAFEPYAAGPSFRKQKLETSLAYYATLRHDAIAFTRAPIRAEPDLLRNRTATAPPAAFVEPHPEAIARVIAALEQLRRGLVHEKLLPTGGPADQILWRAIDMMRTALAAAIDETNDALFSLSLSASLAYLPTELAEWEALIDKTGDTELELAVDLHTDTAAARVRTLGTGPLEALHTIAREPGTGRLVHAVGAHVPAYEIVQPAALRLSDGAFRARLRAGSTPPRFAFTDAFRIDAAPPAPAPASSSAPAKSPAK